MSQADIFIKLSLRIKQHTLIINTLHHTSGKQIKDERIKTYICTETVCEHGF